MKAFWRKFAPWFALFGLGVFVFTALRAKKTGTNFFQAFIDGLKQLFTASVILTALAGGAALWADHSLGLGDGLTLAVLWGTVALSSTGTFNFNYIPQFIEVVAVNSPTLIQINVNGDGMILNLDTNGLASMTHIRTYYRLANSYLFQLADGLLNNKNGTVTITTAATAANVRAWSPNKKGSMYMTFNPAQALASQAYNLSSFAYASFPNAATTDSFQIAYNDGSLDNVSREELSVYAGYFQNPSATVYPVDNISPARISLVSFTPTAAQTFYVMKYQPAYGGIINPNPNV